MDVAKNISFGVKLNIGSDLQNFTQNSEKQGFFSLRSVISPTTLIIAFGNEFLPLITFEKEVTTENIPFGFRDLVLNYKKDLILKKSIFTLVNSKMIVDSHLVFNQSSFVPFLTKNNENYPSITTQSVEWRDSSGNDNNESDDVLSSSSLIPTLSTEYSNQIFPPSFQVIEYQNSVNLPVLRQSLGTISTSLNKKQEGLSIDLKPCQNCKCNSVSAPLGSYICREGTWKDSGLTVPVLNDQTKLKDKVEINTLYIASSDHTLIVNVENKDFFSSILSESLINVQKYAILQGNVEIVINDDLVVQNLSKRSSNTTLYLMSYSSNNDSSFSSIKVKTKSGCVYNSRTTQTQNLISVSFSFDECQINKVFSRNAIIGIVLGSFFFVAGVVLLSIFFYNRFYGRQKVERENEFHEMIMKLN